MLRRKLGFVFLTGLLSACSTCGVISLPGPDFAGVPVDSNGYEIQPMSVEFVASFARGKDVYLMRETGQILRVNDDDPTGTPIDMGQPFEAWGRCLYVSRAGIIFASASGPGLYRSLDGGVSYQSSLSVPVWRMDEDDQGNLYAGNYTKDGVHVATLYKSTDGGANWHAVWSNPENHHIHTVRWDDRQKRLYIAFGDGPSRGQAYSDDRGATWAMLANGPDQGHTDVAFSRDVIIWASDDQSGRVESINMTSGDIRRIHVDTQFIWFAVADEDHVFVGTAVSRADQHACLLASSDQGQTWQKVYESPELATKDYSDGMIAESRCLSAGGWLYFTKAGESIQSYRIRAVTP